MTNEKTTVDHGKLEGFLTSVLKHVGMSDEHSEIVANALIDADLRGIETHGVMRFPRYVERLEAGGMNPCPDISIAETDVSTSIVDGDDGPGQIATRTAMEEGIRLAERSGIGTVGVRNSNHFGTASYYTNYVAKQNYIGICMTQAAPLVVPYGGTERYFGTNPISIAIPYSEFPVTLDIATSITAYGNILSAEETGEKIPPEWAVDEMGHSVTDPKDFYALQPMAEHKGYALALVIDVLSGILMDHSFGENVVSLYDDTSTPQRLGHFIEVIDVDSFTSEESFQEKVDEMINVIKTIPPTDDSGLDELLVPGEPEAKTKQKRSKNGIPIPETVWTELSRIADRYEVESPHY